MQTLPSIRLLTLLFLPIFVFLSCGDDDDIPMTAPSEFYNDGDYAFTYSTTGNLVEIELEALADTTNNLDGIFPDKDLYRLYVDYDGDQVISEGIDLVVSPLEDGRLCVATLINQTSTASCDFFDNTTSTSSFFGNTNHTLSIPKDRLSNRNTTNLVIDLYDPVTNWTRLPSSDTLFFNTLEISW